MFLFSLREVITLNARCGLESHSNYYPEKKSRFFSSRVQPQSIFIFFSTFKYNNLFNPNPSPTFQNLSSIGHPQAKIAVRGAAHKISCMSDIVFGISACHVKMDLYTQIGHSQSPPRDSRGSMARHFIFSSIKTLHHTKILNFFTDTF